MNVGEAARITKLPAKTIRYYEEIGLILPDRKENGYRDYSKPDVQKLCFIQRARSLGFTIEDCRSLTSLYDDAGRKSSDVKSIAQSHLSMIEQKITELQSMHSSLSNLVNDCKGDHMPDCAIIDGLAGKRDN